MFWFLFICDILIPVLMIIFGILMQKNPPKKINGIYGYRTVMSRKNMYTWLFAHEYCGRLWKKIGLITLIPSIIAHIPAYYGGEDMLAYISLVLCTVQCIILCLSIIPVEKALKRTFNPDGTRK